MVLVEAALKGAVIFLIVALLTPLLRRRSAAIRHAVWCFAVCVQLLLPPLVLFAPHWHVPLLASAPWAVAIFGSRDDASGAGTADSPNAAHAVLKPLATDGAPNPATQSAGTSEQESPSTESSRRDSAERVYSWLAIIWLIGAGLVVLHLAIGTIGVWRLAAHGRRVLDAAWLTMANELAVRLGISRPLTLLGGEALAVPMTWGVIYPVVLLPADAESWDDEQRRYVLVHEMAHVRRLDALTHLIGQLTLALFWFSPFVWLAVARMRAEREHACDDYVLQAGTTPSRYANDLLTMVASIGLPNHRPAASAFAALAMARRSEFEGRMLAILTDETDRAPLSHRSIASGAAVAIVVSLGLAGFTPLAAREAGTQAAAARSVATSADTVRKTIPTKRALIGEPRVSLPADAQSHATLLDSALASMPPGGSKTAVLAQYVVSGDTAYLAAALRAVPSLTSDKQKNIVLANAARPALRGGEGWLRDAYFTAAESIRSDADLGAVLVHASANAEGSPAVTIRILHAAASIRSPGPASMVLMNVAQRNLVSSDTIRTLYLRQVNRLGSDDARQRALIALLAVPHVQPHKP
jgi:beta-lactamase regulating signal transducer with metallopeptidase domain